MRLQAWTSALAVVLSTAPAYAQPSAATPTAYFSMGSTIQSITLATNGSPSPALVYSGPTRIGDLALCADGELYFVEPDLSRISRVRAWGGSAIAEVVVQTSGSIGVPGELRLTATCGLRFATPSGAWGIDTLANVPVPSASAVQLASAVAGSGLALTFDGSLRLSDGSSVKGTGFGPAAFGGAVTSVGVANGGSGSVAAPPIGIAAVCASVANRIDCVNKTASAAAATRAQFGTTADRAQYFEFLTNDAIVAATSIDPTQAIKQVPHNGELWLTGRTSPLFVAPKMSGAYLPIVGVAVGPTDASRTETTQATTHQFAFGPTFFEATTPNACALRVAFTQLTSAAAQARVDSVSGPVNYRIDPPIGEESWVADFDVKVVSGKCGAPVLYAISGYLSDAFGASRGVLQCHVTSNGTACDVQTLGDLPFGAVPGDATDTGGSDNFGSDYLTAVVRDNPDSVLTGFSTPLRNAALVTDPAHPPFAAAALNSFGAKNGVPFKFTLCVDASCSQTAPPDIVNYPVSGALLAVQPLAQGPNGEVITGPPCFPEDSGSSTPGKPTFRTGGSSHMFNLKLPMRGPAACQESGIFAATVSSLDGRFVKQTILFTFTAR